MSSFGLQMVLMHRRPLEHVLNNTEWFNLFIIRVYVYFLFYDLGWMLAHWFFWAIPVFIVVGILYIFRGIIVKYQELAERVDFCLVFNLNVNQYLLLIYYSYLGNLNNSQILKKANFKKGSSEIRTFFPCGFWSYPSFSFYSYCLPRK